MSEDTRPSRLRHLSGLVFVAGLVWSLAVLWFSGPMFLRGTIFQDLSVISYLVAAFGVLTLAERIASTWSRH
jgi:hypothetical protein